MGNKFPNVSVIIRSWNQKDQLVRLLQVIAKQNYHGVIECVVVDSESDDGSVEAARAFHRTKVVTIRRSEFSYPLSLNMGADAATGDYLICTVEHALPLDENWIAHGIGHFTDASVAGVYSPVIPHKNASLAERMFYWPGYLYARFRGPYAVKQGMMGTMGATNCALPRILWKQHPFDLNYAAGGEDGQWSAWAMRQGHKIICDSRFTVHHSHGLGFRALTKQVRHWSTLGVPRPFDRSALAFRPDPRFR